VPLVAAATFVIGAGLGLFYPANNFTYIAAAPTAQRGLASAFLATLRTVGGSLGAAATTALFGASGGSAAPSFMPAMHLTLLAAAGVAIAIAVLVKDNQS
jgi:hypothetical protein